MNDFRHAIEVFCPIADTSYPGCYKVLREKVVPALRMLQKQQAVFWHCIVFHDNRRFLNDWVADRDEIFFFHVRLAAPDIDSLKNYIIDKNDFPLLSPRRVELGSITGIDISLVDKEDWRNVWDVIGAASECVARIVEAFPQQPPLMEMAQTLHFITNPFLLGFHGTLSSRESVAF